MGILLDEKDPHETRAREPAYVLAHRTPRSRQSRVVSVSVMLG
jgi:hypothetical protein